MSLAIQVEHLSKSYGALKALDDINFDIKAGSLFGLIGPDGAGKTTLFKVLTSLLIPDEGKVNVLGYDSVKEYQKIRNIIGYMPGKFSLYQDLSVEENLNFFATIFGTTVQENYSLIKEIYDQLLPFKKRRAGKLSGGMKQKLALCCALIHEPKILFLDEPTTGVDAVSRAEFWEMLKRLKSRGITIVVSTPYMDEASLCEEIALIQHGKILELNTPQEIIQNYGMPLYAVSATDFYRSLVDLRNAPFAVRVEAFGDCLHLTATESNQEDVILKFLENKNHEGIEVGAIDATIEDVFLNLSEV